MLTVCSDSFPLLQLKGGLPMLTVCSDSFPELQLTVCSPLLMSLGD